jgi:hypothetical protein
MRYEGGTASGGLTPHGIPGLEDVASREQPILGSRPVWLGPGVEPEYHPEAPCSQQPLADLHSETLGGNGP